MNFHEIRGLFPVVENQIYLNHAACSPISLWVRRALEEYFSRRTQDRVDDFKRDLEEAQDLRENLGKLIDAPADRIALTSNTTHGLNIIAAGLPWQKGDEILLSEMEFPANVYPFLNLRNRGVNIKQIPDNDGRITVDMFRRHATDSTRLISLSFVQYLNGYRADLKRIGQFCSENDILFIVDGIQGLGGFPLSVEDLPIDALASGGHKWLMSPKGTGFLYLTKRLQDRLELPYLGWLSVEHPLDFHNYNQKLTQRASRFELATPNQAGIYGMNAAVQLLHRAGIGSISEHLLRITGYLREKLSEKGYEILTPFTDNERAGIILFSAGSADRNKDLFRTLLDRNVTISYREGFLRVSPHFYNTREDMDQFLTKLNECA